MAQSAIRMIPRGIQGGEFVDCKAVLLAGPYFDEGGRFTQAAVMVFRIGADVMITLRAGSGRHLPGHS
jgi:hypothetical protein